MLENDDLTGPERRVRNAIETGDRLDFRDPEHPELDDPASGANWGPERSVRATFLIELLASDRNRSSQQPRALRLCGARIKGKLDLEAVTLLCPLVLCTCHFDAPLTLDEARAPSIRLDGSWLQSISGRQLQTRGNVTLDRVTTNKLDLEGAHVGGRLSINGAKLHGGVIGYGGLQVDGDMLCREVTAKAQVSLAGAEVGGKLDFDGATLHQNLDLSGAQVGGLLSFDGATLRKDLIAHGLRVGRSMFCRAVDGEQFEATGELRLSGAHVGGDLSFEGAKLDRGMIADGLRVDRDMVCKNVTAEGEVRMPGAHVGGVLSFDGATLRKDLIAHGLRVGRSMFCRAVERQRFEATGELQLSGANIGARLSFEGASLEGGMTAERLQVDWNMLCKNISAKGEMRLLDAHIAGQLSFDGATLYQRLLADGLQVDQGMSCGEDFTAEAEVSLRGARVGRRLSFNRATLHQPLFADGVHVDQGMFCEGLTAEAGVSVVGAHVGGQMSFAGARLSNENGPALRAYRLQIDGDMFCGPADDRKPFESIGELRLPLAHVGGQLILRGAHLSNKNGPALSAEGLQVDGDMFCGAGDDGSRLSRSASCGCGARASGDS